MVRGIGHTQDDLSQAITRHTGLRSITHVLRDDDLVHDSITQGQPVGALKAKSNLALAYGQVAQILNEKPVDVSDVAEKRLARVLQIGRTRAAA